MPSTQLGIRADVKIFSFVVEVALVALRVQTLINGPKKQWIEMMYRILEEIVLLKKRTHSNKDFKSLENGLFGTKN